MVINMDDKSILFFCIVMIIMFSYRILLSIRLLSKKRFIIDEKYYVAFLYTSLVGILVLLTNWLVVGVIMFLLVPLITTIYVSLAKTRVYWIVNGYELTESTFVNNLISYDERFKDASYRLNKIRFNKKKSESKIKLEFVKVDFQEKENLLKVVNDLCKERCKISNKVEVNSIIINSIFILIMLIFIAFTLLT